MVVGIFPTNICLWTGFHGKVRDMRSHSVCHYGKCNEWDVTWYVCQSSSSMIWVAQHVCIVFQQFHHPCNHLGRCYVEQTLYFTTNQFIILLKIWEIESMIMRIIMSAKHPWWHTNNKPNITKSLTLSPEPTTVQILQCCSTSAVNAVTTAEKISSHH